MSSLAQRLVHHAAALATRSDGDTLVRLRRTLVDEEAARYDGASTAADNVNFDRAVAAMRDAAARSSGDRVEVLGVADQRTAILCGVQVPQAAALERHVCDTLRPPGGAFRLVAVTAECVQEDGDMAAVADAVLDCGLYAVCVVAPTTGGVSARRAALLRTALAAGASHPPYVALDGLAHVPPEQRQLIVVDRAHLLGTAQWAALLRVLDKTAPVIVAVGCPNLRSVFPGLSLGDLVPGSTRPDAERALASRLLALPAVAAWASAPRFPTLAQALAGISPLPCLLLHVALLGAAAHTAVVQAQRRHGIETVQTVTLRRIHLLRDADPRPRLIVFEEALRALTLAEWLLLLTHGWCPAAVVSAAPIGRDAPLPLASWIGAARHFPRRLAMHAPHPAR